MVNGRRYTPPAQQTAEQKKASEAATQASVEQRAKELYEQRFRQLGGAALSGPGSGVLDVTGSEEARAGALEGLQLGQMLYGQGMADVGKEAAEYGQMVKGRLGQQSVSADLYRQAANRRLSQQAGKMGMAGATLGGAQEQLRRQAEFEAQARNQEYQDRALALYGKNVGAKQAGLASLYLSGKGVGQAETPTPMPSTSGGISIICTELYNQGKISKTEWLRASYFGYSIHPNTYFGYLTIAKPIVHLMKKSDKFSNLFIGWAKSIAKQKPNLFTRLMMPICFMVGYVRQTKKEKIA
jgi:hypothetical protein